MDAEGKRQFKVEEENCLVKREKREEKAQIWFRARMTRDVIWRKEKEARAKEVNRLGPIY